MSNKYIMISQIQIAYYTPLRPIYVFVEVLISKVTPINEVYAVSVSEIVTVTSVRSPVYTCS